MLARKEFLDFIYIGSPRSGSAWLANALSEHPDIDLPAKLNNHHFDDQRLSGHCRPPTFDCDAYRTSFDGSMPLTVLGDFAREALVDPYSPRRIAGPFPNIKIIAMLRNPVDMLWSMYRHHYRYHRSPPPFIEAVAMNPVWLEAANYHRALTPFFDQFSADQVCVIIYERFFANEHRNLAYLYRYLDVEDRFMPNCLGTHVQGFRDRRRHGGRSLLASLGFSTSDEEKPDYLKSEMGDDDRLRIIDLVEADTRRLSAALDLDLSFWFDHNKEIPDLEDETFSDNVVPMPNLSERRERVMANNYI